MGKLFIVRGLPGAGKTTWANTHTPNALLLENDRLMTIDGKYKFSIDAVKKASDTNQQIAEAVMSNCGSDITVTGVFSLPFTMERYVSMANRYGYNITIVTVKTEFGSVHNVPEKTMKEMRERFMSSSELSRRLVSSSKIHFIVRR